MGSKSDNKIPATLKNKMYKTVIRPTSIDGSACSTQYKAEQQRMYTSEINMINGFRAKPEKTESETKIQERCKDGRLVHQWPFRAIRQPHSTCHIPPAIFHLPHCITMKTKGPNIRRLQPCRCLSQFLSYKNNLPEWGKRLNVSSSLVFDTGWSPLYVETSREVNDCPSH